MRATHLHRVQKNYPTAKWSYFFNFWRRILLYPGWPWTHWIAEDAFAILPTECWDSWHAPPLPVCVVLGIRGLPVCYACTLTNLSHVHLAFKNVLATLFYVLFMVSAGSLVQRALSTFFPFFFSDSPFKILGDWWALSMSLDIIHLNLWAVGLQPGEVRACFCREP